MADTQKCPECGNSLPGETATGLCVGCALKLGLQKPEEGADSTSADSPAPPATIRLNLVPSERPGDVLGRYKLLEKIGEGGFGAVYVAEQREPVKRRVALKIIKLGMDTKEVVARFEVERQALAMMDHPNIAKVLDAGALENGRPYFVMELVRGIKITEYCDKNKLPTEERLDLFVKICHAVQHAHQKGIIHRDIKPSNILVTLHDGVPVPKVIDFGIAKATQGELTDKTVYTQFQQFIGTPAYMSPEQAEMSGLDVDTRSDIYSLGVLLYELLTGRTPFEQKDLIGAGLDEMRRIIREQEPQRPSTRLSTMAQGELTSTAARHQSDAPKLVHSVRGDLDWIVMKCLEKDRTHRYETANGLAMDLKRHLENEPVTARPPSLAYRFQKAWRRNKTAFAVASLIAAVLIAATTISVWQAVRARRAEELAKERLADSEAISKFMTEIFESPDPARDGRSITVAETLDKAARKLETDLSSQPARRAQLQATLADTYAVLGLTREAIVLKEKVRDYYVDMFGRDHPESLKAMARLASSYELAGRSAEALELRQEVLDLTRKVNGPEHADTLNTLGNLANSVTNQNEALKMREEATAGLRKALGTEHPDTLLSMNNLAVSYANAGRNAEALRLREDALPLFRRVFGSEHPYTVLAMNSLAGSYRDAGRLSDAIKLQEEALAASRKMLNPERIDLLGMMHNLAMTYDEAGRRDESIKLREEALASFRKVVGLEHPYTLMEMQALADSYDKSGRLNDAIQLREQVLTLRRKNFSPENPDTLAAICSLAGSYHEAGRHAEADALLANACDTNPKCTIAFLARAAWQAWFGQDADYEITCRRITEDAAETNSSLDADLAAKALCLRPGTNAVRLTNALTLARQAVAKDKNNAWVLFDFGVAQFRNGQFAEARQSLSEAEKKVETMGSGDRIKIQGMSHLICALILFRQGQREEAQKLINQAKAEMPPLPADPSKPTATGFYLDHDVLLGWLLYKEAIAALNEPSVVK